jgi:hypothetical protein
MLNFSVPPRFANRYENWLNAEMQTGSDHNAKGPWILIAAAEAQFIVELQVIRQT